MKGNELLNIMGNIDYKFIKEAEIIPQKKKAKSKKFYGSTNRIDTRNYP